MGFKWIRTFQYRNLLDEVISVDAPRIFLVGENGQGKTNFLESVYYLCYGSSFRTRLDRQICRNGTSSMSVSGAFTVGDSDENRISVRFQNGKKDISFNDAVVADRKEIIQNIPCIVFAHQDIEFVQGSPDMQRWFFDQTLSLFDPTFIDALRRFRRVLRMRNAALKDERLELVETYDPQLIEYGIELQNARKDTVEAFNKTFSQMVEYVARLGDSVSIDYRPSWKTTDRAQLFDILGNKRDTDLRMHTTTTGPHRDRFVFVYRGTDFTTIASTGQTRLLSLVLRVAQALFFSEQAGRRPLLLLDDVLLELDPDRRTRFLSLLPEAEQSFFTFLPDEQYPGHVDESTRVLHVADGQIS